MQSVEEKEKKKKEEEEMKQRRKLERERKAKERDEKKKELEKKKEERCKKKKNSMSGKIWKPILPFEIHVENQVEQEHCLEKSLMNTHINFKMAENVASSDASCRI